MSSKKETAETEEKKAQDQSAASEETNTGNSEASDEDSIIIEQSRYIEELENELEKVKEIQLRKIAELENIKKRLERERIQLFRNAKINAAEAFLPVFDDLIRTQEAMEQADEKSPFYEGIKLVSNKFSDVLEGYGIERIDETGVPFDVNLHDAMLSQKPQDESIESETVLQVLESGYRIGDQTLRHAKVIVSE